VKGAHPTTIRARLPPVGVGRFL